MLLDLQFRIAILLNLPLELRIDMNDIVMGKERSTEQDIDACIFLQLPIDPKLDTRWEMDGPDVEIELHVLSHPSLPICNPFDVYFAGFEFEEFLQLQVARLRHHAVIGTGVEFSAELF